ncbi:LysR family transcriptional regulator [Microaceticoccus formicicus]|uniref:LysR family transcriptional regulator n=1 Tax=Microaceticoccus formicicus TaxID=3118105 RepID=UPI003CCFFC19|nr:LysR family transcriptional regulator [Peptoniphilaceae bacterium AMB_02]
MKFNIYKYVLILAEERNFTKAAKRLYISQPSLSQIIMREEERLGMELFHRQRNSIVPTIIGEEYIKWAELILDIRNKMDKRLQAVSKSETYIINIGILPECSAFILPTPLKQFRELYPNTIVRILELSSNDLEDKLENDGLDFIVGLTHPDAIRFKNIPLYNETIVLAYSKYNPIINDALMEINLSDLEDIPFITMNEGQFLNKVTFNLCKEAGYLPKIVTECYNLETALHMVKAGVGVALIPDLMINLVDGIKGLNLKETKMNSQISIVFQREQYLSRQVLKLIDLIKYNANNS